MQTAPYGTWTSPITAADVAAGEALVEYVGFVGDEVWWTETRPREGGRAALLRRTPDGRISDVLPAPWNVRTRVIEYGGRPWLALGDRPGDGFVLTHWDDQRVYRAVPGGEPAAISPVPALPAGARYCDFTRVGDEVWCLRETLTGRTPTDVHRDLVALPLDGRAAADPAAVRVLGAGHHFLTGPRVSPDGTHAAWLGWDHPDMPWISTDLMVAPVSAAGTLGGARRVAGGDGVSVGQVEWAPDEPGVLFALADPDGWWNVHRIDLAGTARNLCPREEEFGEALWRIGARWFLPVGGGRLFVLHGTGARQLAVLEDGALRDIGQPYTEWAQVATDGTRVAGVAGSPRHRRTVVLADPDGPRVEPLRPAEAAHPAYLPESRYRRCPGPGGQDVHAYVHPPRNPDFTAPAGERPPYLVLAHGGPTSRFPLVVNEEIAFFTSRGIGVVDVQYGGSTGFGREYRDRLHGNWGHVDVRDCATAVRALIDAGEADPDRIGIRGGSAGGWTATASLGREPDLYRVAGIYFPVLDPVAWRTAGTHDFESQYLDSLLGPWPQARARYEELSPLAHADRIRAPFVLLQGLEDEVCPPAQAERLLAVARAHGVPHTYLAFPGEQHGFRRQETVVACLEAELALYTRVFAGVSAAPAAPAGAPGR